MFIHEFFADRKGVRDGELVPLIERTLDRKSPSRWYNALMDYGAMLAREHGNANLRSAHYARQSPFENSNRQVRGAILKALVSGGPMAVSRIVERTGMEAGRVKRNLVRMEKEGFIRKKGKSYSL